MSHGLVKDYLVKATGETDALISGTVVDVSGGAGEYTIATGLPSGITQFTLAFQDVSLSSTANWGFQLGYGSTPTYVTAGYSGSATRFGSTTLSTNDFDDVAGFNPGNGTYLLSGSLTFTLIDAATNKWAWSGNAGEASNTVSIISGGSVTLSGELTAVKIIDTGSNTFDDGEVNIVYENPDLAVSYNGTVPAGVTDVFVNGTHQSIGTSTTKDITGIPSGVKNFKVMFQSVSTDLTSPIIIQLGDAGGIETTGYDSSASYLTGAGQGDVNSTAGFIMDTDGAAGYAHTGWMEFSLMDAATNLWVASFVMADDGGGQRTMGAGYKALSGELTQLRITTTGGTAVFDSGNINVQYDNQELDLGSGVISGGVVQTVHVQDGAVFTGATTVPADDTIPQSTEGNEWQTISITPQNSANKLRVDVVLDVSWSGTNGNVVTALFLDSETDARAAKVHTNSGGAGSSGFNQHETLTYWMTAGQTTSMTFKVRVGGTVAGTVTVNGWNSGRILGGVMASSISITEYKV